MYYVQLLAQVYSSNRQRKDKESCIISSAVEEQYKYVWIRQKK